MMRTTVADARRIAADYLADVGRTADARAVGRHLAAGRWDEAEADARRFTDDHPELAEAHVVLGDVLRETWQLDEARTAFDAARTLDTWCEVFFEKRVDGLDLAMDEVKFALSIEKTAQRR